MACHCAFDRYLFCKVLFKFKLCVCDTVGLIVQINKAFNRALQTPIHTNQRNKRTYILSAQTPIENDEYIQVNRERN